MILIHNGTVIDGTGAEPRARTSLLIEGERIRWIGPADAAPARQQETTLVDATDKYVIPGLIDAHVHVSRNGREAVSELLKRDRDRLVLEGVESVRNILRSGTTAVRDVGTLHYIEMSLRWAIDAGHIPGPRMRTSGKFLAITGGHAFLTAREADGPEEFRKAAREQIRAGADTIKLMATGGAATPGQDVQASQMSADEIRAAVEAAHAMNRPVAAHCHGAEGIKNCLLAGVDSIEHGTFLDEETADLMLARGKSLVLTLAVANVDVSKLSATARADADRLMRVRGQLRERMRETVALARAKGVLVGAGTDAGGNPLAPHDFSMAGELETLVAYGFPPLEALTAATKNNARILRWEQELGTLEPGKLADLVILNADPVADISNVRQVSAVFKGGRQVTA